MLVMAFGGLQNYAPPIFERTYGVALALATTGLTAYLLGNAAGKHRRLLCLRASTRIASWRSRGAPAPLRSPRV
jgi:hypothetical protein